MGALGFSSTTDDVLAGHDLTGTHALVTGASTGLGEETARALAAHGASVTLAVRDVARGDAAVGRITATVPAADLAVRELDLASLASVRRFAEGFGAEHPTLDVLINNAGLMVPPAHHDRWLRAAVRHESPGPLPARRAARPALVA